jgi:hypothetical protein
MGPSFRILFAVALFLHGLVHMLGFVVPWGLAEVDGLPCPTSAAWGRIPLRPRGVRVLGMGWFMGTLAFALAAAGVWTHAPWGSTMAAVAATYSLALCILGSPAAAAGIPIDLAILTILAAEDFGLLG